jgi:hypothetical protein
VRMGLAPCGGVEEPQCTSLAYATPDCPITTLHPPTRPPVRLYSLAGGEGAARLSRHRLRRSTRTGQARRAWSALVRASHQFALRPRAATALHPPPPLPHPSGRRGRLEVAGRRRWQEIGGGNGFITCRHCQPNHHKGGAVDGHDGGRHAGDARLRNPAMPPRCCAAVAPAERLLRCTAVATPCAQHGSAACG